MNAKWRLVAMSAMAVAVAVIGLSVANGQDDDKSLEKIMEDVTKQNNVLRKAVRSAPNFKKDLDTAHKASEKLVELGKKARDITSAAEKNKKEVKVWTDAVDKFIKASEKLVETTKADGDQPAAKKAFADLTKTCTDCHADFRVEDDF